MNTSTDKAVLGIDLGSAYIKAVVLDGAGQIVQKGLASTGYDYADSVASLIDDLDVAPEIKGVTGYGRKLWEGVVRKNEISSLAKGIVSLGISDATLVDIGGQDCKVLHIREGKLAGHALNQRCAAGTGSYLEFIAFRMSIDADEMSELAAKTKGFHPLNSFCTVFASTEILDCIKNKVPLPDLIRGMYASIAERIRGMTHLDPPVYLSGGVIAHHSILLEVFEEVLGVKADIVPDPQYLAAVGVALYARESQDDRKV